MTAELKNFEIKVATEKDVPVILKFIREHADHVNDLDKVVATEAILKKYLFSQPKYAECIISYLNQKPAGFAVFFYNFSTYLGEPTLYIDDLYVQPEFRSKGIGRNILQHIARLAVKRNCKRLEWNAPKENEKTIRFYKSLGALIRDHITPCRLDGEALSLLAEKSSN